ncbi:MAG: hypothetical protein C0507_16990 [Cyanobacteria bacterium PR.3.49]|nr:hypothetical protein [Cyanobacteria bacterium PR.3.49]
MTADKSQSRGSERISLIICCILFVGIGILHFTNTSTFTRIVPDFIPYPDWAVYISGVMEILGGVLMYFRKTRRFASYFLIVLLIAVFPANINMAVNHIDFGKVPTVVLWARLPLQALLIYWVYQLRKVP